MKAVSLYVLCSLVLLGGCRTTPEGIVPVKDFEASRYTGTWYEVARLDNRFERGLSNISAVYTLREDGDLDVINRGYVDAKEKWKESKGRAKFVDRPDVAALTVSFFWPFSGGYNVIALDRDGYAWSLVCGPDRSYLWILARDPEIDEIVVDELVRRARSMGFETDDLIYVKHDRSPGS